MDAATHLLRGGRALRPLSGVRASDWVLTTVFVMVGAVLMLGTILSNPDELAIELARGTMVHLPSSRSWGMIPLFALALLPLLWWRRGVLEVTVACTAAMGVHVLVFGWVTRCGVGLPLAFLLVYLAGAHERGWRAVAAWLAGVVLVFVVLVRDATTGLVPLPLCLIALASAAVLGLLAGRRAAAIAELAVRTEELRVLRDERAALEVAADRALVTHRIDQAVSSRLGLLATEAEASRGLPAEQLRASFASLEAQSRHALEEMRRIVGGLDAAPEQEFDDAPRL
ncbi:hypothetical protein [Tessaracoccus caeni]|uniref:hypothetical protein n=1 Tax=Tessaracoccus caeni TaxID=3031239 RepID=UPI0023DA276D|nr:hypothetical protein [Tessaracoccus caeni]MDF1487192.1 hypothetical protein [Tessaracoccus caeni]